MNMVQLLLPAQHAMQRGLLPRIPLRRLPHVQRGLPRRNPLTIKSDLQRFSTSLKRRSSRSSLPVPSRVSSVSECSVPVPSVKAPTHVFFQKQSWLCVHSCSTAARPTSSPTLRLSHITATAISDRLACFQAQVMDLPAFRLGYGLACFQAHGLLQAHFLPFLFLLPPGNVFLSVMNVVMQMLMGIPFRGSP